MFNSKVLASFKNQLVLILLVATLLPALIVAGILLQQITQDAQENVESQLQIQLQSASTEIHNRVTIIDSLLKQLALDQNNILAAENSVFSVYARAQLQRVNTLHPEILFLQIYDTQFWPAESVPFEYEFMSLESVFHRNPGMLPKGNATVYRVLADTSLMNLINEHANTPINNDSFLFITEPLDKTNEASPGNDIRTGYLVAVISLNGLLTSKDEHTRQFLSVDEIQKVGLDDDQPTIVESIPIKFDEETIHLGIEYSREQIVKPIYRAMTTVAMITLAILVVSIYAALYLSRRFTRPFNSIESMIHGYRDGKFEAEIPHFTFKEFVSLSELLVNMASIIDKNQQELEARVEERTQELGKANSELKTSLETLKNMQGKLVESEKMAQLGGLVAGISHEVNTPLGIGLTAASSMRSFVDELNQLFESNQLSRKRMTELLMQCDECATILMTNLTRSADLISNFKEVAVSQSSSEITQFNLLTFLSEIVNSLKPQTKKFNLVVDIDVDENIEMKSYQGVFAQIFTNFMMNSMRHAFEPDKSHNITIKATADSNGLSLTYKDDGAGMTEQHVKRIFEPFFTTKRGQGGTGLGMHIVYNLVTQKLEGEIHIESVLGDGTTIVIRMPNSHLYQKSAPARVSNQ